MDKRKRAREDVIELDDSDDEVPHARGKRTASGNGILGKFVGGMTGGGAPFSWNGEPLVKREAGLMEEEGRHMETSQDRRDEEEQASPIIHFGSMQRGDDAENNDPNVGMDDDETQDEDFMKASSQEEEESERNIPMEPEACDKPITDALMACAKAYKDNPHSEGGGALDAIRAAPSRRNMISFFDGVLESGQGSDEVEELVAALADIQDQDTFSRMMTKTGKQLNHILKKVQVKLPESSSSLKSAPREAPMEAMAGSPPVATQTCTGNSHSPEDNFIRELGQCNEMLRQYKAVDEKLKRVRDYTVSHRSGCKAILKEHEKLPSVYQHKVAKCGARLKEARKSLLSIDQRFDEILRNDMSLSPRDATNAASLTIVTGVLDLIRGDKHQALVENRKRAADAVDKASKDLKHQRAILKLVEASWKVVRVVVGAAKVKLKMARESFEFEAHELKKEKERALQHHVESAAKDFQEVISFHENRKSKADKNIQQRSEELRDHKALFGNETPTEVKRLEECIAELKKAKDLSDSLVNKCMSKNQEFWGELDSSVPPELSQKLGAIFQELMVHSKVSHYYETLTQSQAMVMDSSHLQQYQQKDNTRQARQQAESDDEDYRRRSGGGKMPAVGGVPSSPDNGGGGKTEGRENCIVM